MKRKNAKRCAKVDGVDSVRIAIPRTDIYENDGGVVIKGRELRNLKAFIRRWNQGWRLSEYDTMESRISALIDFFCSRKACTPRGCRNN